MEHLRVEDTCLTHGFAAGACVRARQRELKQDPDLAIRQEKSVACTSAGPESAMGCFTVSAVVVHLKDVRRCTDEGIQLASRDGAVNCTECEWVRALVYEKRQAAVPGARSPTRGAKLLLQLEIGGVPVMSVGDQGLSWAEIFGDGRQPVGVRDAPDPMGHTVRAPGLDQRRLLGRGLHDLAGRPPSVIGEEDGLEVGRAGPHQREPVRHRSRKDVLVRKDHLLGGLAEVHRTDEPTEEDGTVAPGGRGGCGGSIRCPGSHVVGTRAVSLCAAFVDIQRRFGISEQHTVGAPLPEQSRRLAVFILPVGRRTGPPRARGGSPAGLAGRAGGGRRRGRTASSRAVSCRRRARSRSVEG